ncbi:pupal cuticle protein Edg-78E-like [Culicoides brevitarsis]|uniref:pupal cuticle protein Edg-78E-like n=1 Tax=Culicoides brevitarsis TaxID=469753 RepID=UPI00307BB579
MIKSCIALALFATCVFAANLDQDATVTRLENVVNPDGTYNYAYETSNGIAANEEGEGGVRASGQFSYVSPEGETIQVSYTADENGFQPDNLPQPPPIPEAIQKALEYIAAHPSEEARK